MKKIVEVLLTISIVLLMLLVIMYSVFENVPLMLASAVAVLYVSAATLYNRNGMVTIIVLYIIVVAFNWNVFLKDTYSVLQQIAVVMANERSIFLQPFEQDSTYNGGLFASLIALLIAIAAVRAVQQRSTSGVMLLVICTILVQIVLKTTAPVLVTVGFFMVVFLTVIYMKNESFYKKFIPMSVVTVTVFTMTVVVFQITNVSGHTIINAVHTKLDSWRFNSELTRLPSGQLQYATKQVTADDVALQVVMEKPVPMYLKGFIGTQLYGDEWKRIEGSHYLQHKSLLEALQREGFTNYNQFALAATAQQQVDLYKMSVQNIDADRRYGYLPYEAQTVAAQFQTQEGAAVISSKWRGASSYDLTYVTTTVQQYPKVANQLYSDEDNSYLNMETYYNEVVYDSYLQIADDDRALLANHVQIDAQQVTYEQAIDYVQQFLEQNMEYSEQVAPVTSIQQLLEETKEGYAPHYATLATLLFRTLQVPARYVEGYIVTKQDVKGKSAFSEIPIAAQNAHAWTEIYIDKVGWIPVEVTPGYEEKMPTVNMDDYPAFEGASFSVQSEQVAGATQTEQVKDEKIDNEKTTPEVNVQKQAYWWVLIALLAFLAALLLFKKLKLKNYLQTGTTNVQATRYWTLLLYMLERELKSTNIAALTDPILNEVSLQQAQQIYEKAKYSGQLITNEELNMIRVTCKAVKKALQKNKKHIHKLPMLWRY